MMQRRTLFSSLLLVSLLSAFAFTGALAQNTVTVQSKNSPRCVTGSVNVTVDIAQSVSALEIVLDYSGSGTVNSVTFDGGFTSLAGIRGVDLGTPGKIRLWAVDNTGGSDCLAAGTKVVASIEYTTSNVCSGALTFTGGTFTCSSNDVTASSQFATCEQDASLIAATVNSGTVTIVNSTPTVACPGDVTMHWGTVQVVHATGGDPDLANGCEKLTYSLGGGSPSYASIAQNGNITLAPNGGDVCEATVTVVVTDSCGATANCSFDVCVQNTPPVATCPSESPWFVWGETVTAQVTGNDPDNGPVALAYSVVDWAGPGPAPTVDGSGNVSWPTEEDPAYIGEWEICVAVTDGAAVCDPCSPSNADTCCFTVLIVPTYRVCIETVEDVIQGGSVDVSISLSDGYENYPMAGYDFLIDYDPSALNITGATEGGFFTGNEWEYFTYRFGPFGNCGSGCPSGKFRIVALAEMNDGAHHPTGYTNTDAGSSELAVLHFLVTNDRTFECQFVGIDFCWYDCGDNTISSVSGDSLYISRYIYPAYGESFGDGGAGSIHDVNASFPTKFGANVSCETSGGPGKPEPIRKIDFCNGGVKIVCADSIDARGDINLDGASNTIADAVLFTNYFIHGLSAFHINVDGQIAATEINGDGIPLTVADLVYLIRIIVGDQQPLPKLVHNTSVAGITKQGDEVRTDMTLGAVHLVFNGITDVTLLAPNVELKTGVVDGNTHALIYSMEGNVINPGSVVAAHSDLISVDASDEFGWMLSSTTQVLPTEFAVHQNYPNPFNPSTKITFDVPTATEYVVSIYNVAGQKVTEIAGHANPGVEEVVWNADSFASGVYFYKVAAFGQTVTKKMVLLK